MHRAIVTFLGLALVFVSLEGVCCRSTWAEEAKAVIGIVAAKPDSGHFVQTPQGFMVPYTAVIPGTQIKFEMVPVPAGKFQLGSPESESARGKEEGPQVEVEIAPYWIGKYEITWAEYKHYMTMHDRFKELIKAKLIKVSDDNKAQIVTAPSNLYDPTFTFQFGEDPRQPALSMSQFAAKQYTKWLSGLTGDFYRLPSEAEWEYAARAGTKTAYYFGDDASQLAEHGWFVDNAEETTQKVGQKKPSPWGLYDIYGNVAEWTLDEFTAEGYAKLAAASEAGKESIQWPTKLFPRTMRGGGWDDDAAKCRSAARHGSHDDDYRGTDPNFPKSPWWFTDDHGLAVGMRLVRPLTPPPAADFPKYWDADVPSIQSDADDRIDNQGRGARGIVSPELPKLIENLKASK